MLEQNNKTISIKKGRSFLLKLGNLYDWSIDITNQTVVSRIMNVMVIKSVEGLYQAHSFGQTTLTTTGDPTCYKETRDVLYHQFSSDWISTLHNERQEINYNIICNSDTT